MRHTYLFFLFFLFFLKKEGFAQNSDLSKQIFKILKYDTEIKFDQTPSFIVGVLDKDIFAVELIGDTLRKPVLNNESRFELGSLSKVLTIMILKSLEKKGIINFDSTVNSYLPLDYQNPRLNYLKIHDLIYYASGFPNYLVGMGNKQSDVSSPYEQFSKKDVLTFYKNYVRKDTLYNDHYSDLDYSLLGIIIECATNEDFQTNLENEVNTVLGSNFFVTKYEEKVDLVVEGMSIAGIWSKGSYFNSFESSLGVKGCMLDLEKLLRFLLSDSFNIDNQSFQKTWNKGVVAKDGLYMIKVKKNQNVLASYGHTNIHQVFLGIKQNTGTGVIVLANSSSGTKDLGMLLLKMINNNWKRKN